MNEAMIERGEWNEGDGLMEKEFKAELTVDS